MKSENRNKLLTWAVIALVLLNLTTLVTIIYNRSEADQESVINDSFSTQVENTSVKFSGRYFRDYLDLNADQMIRFREFNPVFRQHVRDINSELNNLRRKMLDELASSGYDSLKLDLLSDSVGSLHAELKKLTCKYYLDFKEICNKEQKLKLEQLFGEMFATDTPTGQYGQGNSQGRGRGRRINNQ